MAKEWKVRRVRTRVSQIEYREREKEENKRESHVYHVYCTALPSPIVI